LVEKEATALYNYLRNHIYGGFCDDCGSAGDCEEVSFF
jgi:hypothetical protein